MKYLAKKRKYKVIIGLIAIVGLIAVLFTHNSQVKSISCEPNCSDKSIGTINPIGGTFVPNPAGASLIKDQEYWLRIKVEGQDTITPTAQPGATPAPLIGKDIYMTLDGSSSMGEMIPEFKTSSDPKITMLEASKKTMSAFVDKSVGKNIYMGLAMNSWCEQYRQYSPELNIQWVYEDDLPYNSNGQNKTGRGLVFKPLQMLDGQQNSFKSTINAIGYETIIESDGTPDYRNLPCRRSFGGGSFAQFGVPWNGLSTLGAAISMANFEFSNILFDPDAVRSSDNSPIRTSRGYTQIGQLTHGGPRARDMTGTVIPKILVLVTDGGDGVPPFYDDEEIDKASRAIYQRAKDNNIKIYAITFSPLWSLKYARLESIVNFVGGKLYRYDSAEEMIEKFDLLAADIDNQYPSTLPTPSPGIVQSSVIVKEVVNRSNFKMLEPVNGTTFRVSRDVNGVEIQEQNTICPDIQVNTVTTGNPDCVSNKQYSAGNLFGMNISLPPMRYGDTKYIYIKVVPIDVGSNVFVDNPISELEYPDLNLGSCPSACPDIPNFTVNIGNPPSYFQVLSGNVYSKADNNSIRSDLPLLLDRFLTSNNGIVLSNGTTNFGAGKVSESMKELKNYTIQTKPLYDEMYEKNSSKITSTNISGIDQLSSGVYLDTSTNASSPFKVQGSEWENKQVSGKKVVIFVPGDLIINANFTIAKDGNSLLLFVVKGNIGIDPRLDKLQGIYLTDGKIDTVCNGNFQSNGTCLPAGGGVAEAPLLLEGIYYAQKGYNLDRNAAAGSSEIFSYRPDLFFSAIDIFGSNNYSWRENLQ